MHEYTAIIRINVMGGRYAPGGEGRQASRPYWNALVAENPLWARTRLSPKRSSDHIEEAGFDRGAERSYRGEDGQCHACHDEAVLDRGGTVFVAQEARLKINHCRPSFALCDVPQPKLNHSQAAPTREGYDQTAGFSASTFAALC